MDPTVNITATSENGIWVMVGLFLNLFVFLFSCYKLVWLFLQKKKKKKVGVINEVGVLGMHKNIDITIKNNIQVKTSSNHSSITNILFSLGMHTGAEAHVGYYGPWPV